MKAFHPSFKYKSHEDVINRAACADHGARSNDWRSHGHDGGVHPLLPYVRKGRGKDMGQHGTRKGRRFHVSPKGGLLQLINLVAKIRKNHKITNYEVGFKKPRENQGTFRALR